MLHGPGRRDLRRDLDRSAGHRLFACGEPSLAGPECSHTSARVSTSWVVSNWPPSMDLYLVNGEDCQVDCRIA